MDGKKKLFSMLKTQPWYSIYWFTKPDERSPKIFQYFINKKINPFILQKTSVFIRYCQDFLLILHQIEKRGKRRYTNKKIRFRK